jgi:hypothetical protein
MISFLFSEKASSVPRLPFQNKTIKIGLQIGKPAFTPKDTL